jgi:hypothetical protein
MEENRIYEEVRQLRYLLAKVVGTQDLPKRDQFSKEAVKKAASKLHYKHRNIISGINTFATK